MAGRPSGRAMARLTTTAMITAKANEPAMSQDEVGAVVALLRASAICSLVSGSMPKDAKMAPTLRSCDVRPLGQSIPRSRRSLATCPVALTL